MSTSKQFSLNVKYRGLRVQQVPVPTQFMFYSFGIPRYVTICAVCPEGVAITIRASYNRKLAKKFLAHSTVYNYFRFSAAQAPTAEDCWDGDGTENLPM
jgi:hypothetical protein